jgi:creatinine amidohydrolase
MVAPAIAVGMAEHHMAFPGTVTYRPSTLIEVVSDYVLSLARHGFRRFVFVNGHGGNIATVNAAFYQAYATADARAELKGADLRCRLANWWTSDSVRALTRKLYGDRNGMHAAASEIAVTQFVHPDASKQAPLDPPVAPGGTFYGPEDFRRRFPDGRIGSDPWLATPEHGGRLVAAADTHIAAEYRDFTRAE